MKMTSRKPHKIDPMQKKVPINPKYKDVKPTIDTGASLTKQLQKIEELKQNYKFSKDEIFKRMKATTFVQLVVQVFRLSNDDFEMPENGQGDMDTFRSQMTEGPEGRISPAPSFAFTEGDFNRDDGDSIHTSRSTLLGVAQGIGEMDLKDRHETDNHRNNNSNNSNINSQLIINGGSAYSNSGDLCPYLLLDVREKDDYDSCHIIPALSYPKAILSRSVNYESKEMLAFKNKEGKIIVLYDDDEKMASVVATTLVQRGYDNIFMLSGGLKVAYKLFPEGLIVGTIPAYLLDKSSSRDTRKLNGSSSEVGQRTLKKEDVDKLEIYLSNSLHLSSLSGSSSRMSSSSRSSKMSSSSNQRNPVLGSSRIGTGSSTNRSSSSTLNSSRPTFRP